MEREIKLVPGYASEACGKHPAELLFILRFPNEGAVVAIVNTGWYLDGERVEPRFVQLSIHSVVANFDPVMRGEEICHHCAWLGEPCWVPRSSFYQPGFLPGLRRGGSDWVFARMEEYWREWKEGGPATVWQWDESLRKETKEKNDE